MSAHNLSGGDDGNYIMYHLSGDGSRPNHFEFSSCSRNSMYRILRNRIHLCFQEHYIAFCSNTIIDSKYMRTSEIIIV